MMRLLFICKQHNIQNIFPPQAHLKMRRSDRIRHKDIQTSIRCKKSDKKFRQPSGGKPATGAGNAATAARILSSGPSSWQIHRLP